MSLLRIYSLTGATVIATVGIATAGTLMWLKARRKTPEQREMLRRQYICARGRITDGSVLDVHQLDTIGGQPMQMVLYSYEVAGVHYECSQELTHLRQFFDLDSCSMGVAASVRYDPQHPGNSIVLAETWCGLRIWPRTPGAPAGVPAISLPGCIVSTPGQ